MARKVKFPLEMKEGVLVRTIEELKENFDINKIIGYYIDGKLVKWLEDRGYQEELDKIIRLDKSDKNLNKKLCEIFEIEFIEDNKVDLEKIEKEKFKIQQLKQHTDDENIIKNIEIIAFNQDELLDLLYKGYKEIYLYGEMFDISLSNENMTYIGINNPKVLVNKEIISNVINKNIKFKNIKFFDENTKEILEDICLFEYKPSVLYSKLIENDKAKTLELFKLISNNIDEIDEFIRKNIKYEAFYNKINSIDYYFNNNNNLENINLSSRKLGKILFEKDDNDKYFNFMLDKLQLKRKINDINSMVLDASMGFMLFATYDSKELINIIIDRIKRQDDTIKIHYIYFIILTLALYKFKEKFISLISDFLCLINISIYELEDIINIIKLTFDCGGNNNMFKTQIAKDYYETYIKDAKEIEFFFWIPNIFGE